MEILKTLEKSHVGGWFPWGFLPAPDSLILWRIPDACKDVDLDVLVDALKPVGPFKKIGKVFRREEDSTVGLLQIGDGVDPLLIPRQVRLAGGVWRVLSKPATREAAFRERLLQFLQEEGRTLDDLARVLDRSTPHPPQPPRRDARRPARRRVPQARPPPPRLVVGTYDSSERSDSDPSDLDAAAPAEARAGPGRRRARRAPVSYLGSKFLGSDVESEEDEELVQAFLRRGEKPPAAAPARRRPPHLPAVPMFDNLGPQVSKAERWRQYVSQVSWGKLRQRVKGWAPRSGVEEARPPQAFTPAASGRNGPSSSPGSSPGSGGQGGQAGNGGDRRREEASVTCWRPKIKWASFRLRRREAASRAPEVDSPARDQEQEADSQREEAINGQRVEAGNNQRAEAADHQRVEVVADQEEEISANQRAEAPADQRAEAGAQAIQEAEALVGSEALEIARSRTRKQAKTVRFQTPRRFSWFHKRRRAFWYTPRLPTLPKRVPRTGEARSLSVLRAEARAEAEQGEQEVQL
ncbi:coiled-coil domain-containing protein 8 [Perognathus longimembris pacificus]|uniref:coiled-coil domain-containing protein 8 n=1 Tax=Perognathus longimembris pacificus TaxID=214514 RepID=UPI0020186C94|nr:coiled-coil domain-containing protein 8 [Perognathus longimembris pacificus]